MNHGEELEQMFLNDIDNAIFQTGILEGYRDVLRPLMLEIERKTTERIMEVQTDVSRQAGELEWNILNQTGRCNHYSAQSAEIKVA